MIKAKYLKIEVDNKAFYRVVRVAVKGGESSLKLENNKPNSEYIQKLRENNEFIRITHKHYYADLHFKDVNVKTNLIIIQFSKIIDYNNTKFIPNEKR